MAFQPQFIFFFSKQQNCMVIICTAKLQKEKRKKHTIKVVYKDMSTIFPLYGYLKPD